MRFFFFFFNDTATTEIYTLSLHDALPICDGPGAGGGVPCSPSHWLGYRMRKLAGSDLDEGDRKSTRLNSSHLVISYAGFCLKKKKEKGVLSRPVKASRAARSAASRHRPPA